MNFALRVPAVTCLGRCHGLTENERRYFGIHGRFEFIIRFRTGHGTRFFVGDFGIFRCNYITSESGFIKRFEQEVGGCIIFIRSLRKRLPVNLAEVSPVAVIVTFQNGIVSGNGKDSEFIFVSDFETIRMLGIADSVRTAFFACNDLFVRIYVLARNKVRFEFLSVPFEFNKRMSVKLCFGKSF